MEEEDGEEADEGVGFTESAADRPPPLMCQQRRRSSLNRST